MNTPDPNEPAMNASPSDGVPTPNFELVERLLAESDESNPGTTLNQWRAEIRARLAGIQEDLSRSPPFRRAAADVVAAFETASEIIPFLAEHRRRAAADARRETENDPSRATPTDSAR